MTQFEIICCFIEFAFFIFAGQYMQSQAKRGDNTGKITSVAGIAGIVLMIFYLITCQ